MNRLEFDYERTNRHWMLAYSRSLVPWFRTSRTKAENVERREAHKCLVGIGKFKVIYEWEDNNDSG